MSTLMPLALADFKMIFRDPSLRIFLFLPALIFLVILIAIPALVGKYPGAAGFVDVILMGALVQTSTMFGFIYSMVLIDEKDMQVSVVYGILPISKVGFIAARLLFPFIISSSFSFLLLIVQPFYALDPWPSIVLAFLSGSIAPVLILIICNLSKNKMEGMTWYKLVNLFITIPLLAFIIPKYAVYFSILPTYWVYRALDLMIEGKAQGLTFLMGYLYLVLLTSFLLRGFTKIHFRS